MKRAQLSIQFNWIFVLIVGSTILAAILAFTFSVEDTSDQRIAIQLAQQFETIFTSTLQQPGTGKEYQSPPLDLTFVCDYEQDLYHYEVDGVVARQTQYDLIASSDELSTSRLRTFALEWNVPYPIDTFLYLTTPQEEFVFYTPTSETPSSNIQRLLDVFPDNFTQRVVFNDDVPALADANNDRVILIHVVNDLNNPSSLLDSDALEGVDNVHAVVIDPGEDGLFRSGEVLFLDGTTYEDYADGSLPANSMEEQTERYIGEAALFAALFTENQDSYRCLMSKATDRLNMVTQILLKQLDAMEEDIDGDCKEYLLGSDLTPNSVKRYLEDINSSSRSGYSSGDYATIFTSTRSIETRHQQIILEQQCPLLY